MDEYEYQIKTKIEVTEGLIKSLKAKLCNLQATLLLYQGQLEDLKDQTNGRNKANGSPVPGVRRVGL